jgi:hypothetical protein
MHKPNLRVHDNGVDCRHMERKTEKEEKNQARPFLGHEEGIFEHVHNTYFYFLLCISFPLLVVRKGEPS